MAQKPKASKMARTHVVQIERATQVIREQCYRIRAVLEPGIDVETVEAELVPQIQKAFDDVNAIIRAASSVLAQVHELPVVEDVSTGAGKE